MTSIVWFRRDLRLADNAAWAAATQHDDPICALFVLDPVLVGTAGPLRYAQMLAHLRALDQELALEGGRLRIEHGQPAATVAAVARETGARRLFLNADTTPYSRRRDDAVAAGTPSLEVSSHWSTLVHPPGSVLAGSGRVSRVFTPFHRLWDATPWSPWCEPAETTPHVLSVTGAALPDAAESTSPWLDNGGERAALERLAAFDQRADQYLDARDFPAIPGTSALSADLRFGTISPRRVIEEIGIATAGRAGFVRQLAWRDWYADLLWESPHLTTTSMKPDMAEIEWINDNDQFEAWTQGRTGYPIIDAGMRELAATGRMHNRVRMLCASFLVKDLLVDWRWGERWFRRHLIDADVSQNVGNWQWAAGTGPDAAPFFRVFNPTLQSRKFDHDGAYIKRWVPELTDLSAEQVHCPSLVGPLELAAAGVVLGDNYPQPVVGHAAARARALTAYGVARSNSPN